jgi:hypothetical protein
MEEQPRFLILFCFSFKIFCLTWGHNGNCKAKNQGAYISNLQDLLHDNDNDDSNQGF